MIFPGISTGIHTFNPWPVDSNRGRKSQGADGVGEDGDSSVRPGSPREAISEADRWASANQSMDGETADPWLSEGVVVSRLEITASGRSRCWRFLVGECGIRVVSGGGRGRRGRGLMKKILVGTSGDAG